MTLLSVLLWVLLWTVVALVGTVVVVLVLVLLVPLELAATWRETCREAAVAGPGVRLRTDLQTRTLEVRVFGRLWLRRPLGRGGEEERRDRRRRRRRPARRLRPARLWAQRRALVAALTRFVRGIRIRHLEAEVVIASEDPAVTGAAAGLAYAVRGTLPRAARSAVRIRPAFDLEAPVVEGEVAIRMQPVRAVALGLRVWRVVRRSRAPARTVRRRSVLSPRPAGGRGGSA